MGRRSTTGLLARLAVLDRSFAEPMPEDGVARGRVPACYRERPMVWLLWVVVLTACSPGPGLSPEAERGRQVYLAQCTACHASDPGQIGPLGPDVKGSSRDLLEARLVKGTYPPGYSPKRPSAVMQPMPQLAPSIGDLAAYLR